jgi:hypothetical protein
LSAALRMEASMRWNFIASPVALLWGIRQNEERAAKLREKRSAAAKKGAATKAALRRLAEDGVVRVRKRETKAA